jgi:sporulation protein YlmC with PRC-barrel domain
MKRLASGLIAFAFVAALPGAGLAQSTSTERGATERAGTERRADDRAKDRAKKDRAEWSNTQGLHETGDIIGTSVDGPDGKSLGKVDALLIDPKDGKISHAVVSLGGVLGVGAEKVVVPFSALKMTGHENGRKGRIAIDQSALDQAPKYVKATDRQPSASPATDRRSGTTSGSGGLSGDPRSDSAKRDADAKAKDGKVGANQSDAKSPDKKY